MGFEMNTVNLNEYINEGLGEIHALIAHEILVFFKRLPQQSLSFQRRSNTSFLVVYKKLGMFSVSYQYEIETDRWCVSINGDRQYINKGRSKNVSQISLEIIKFIIS